jgi:hypothetical protein
MRYGGHNPAEQNGDACRDNGAEHFCGQSYDAARISGGILRKVN